MVYATVWFQTWLSSEATSITLKVRPYKKKKICFITEAVYYKTLPEFIPKLDFQTTELENKNISVRFT
jgi:hypothetical protein